MTTQEHHHPQTADQRIPDTEIIAVATPAPVFVDSTGRRSRLLRRIALAFGILVVSYGGLLGVSLAGGPVNSSAVLPLPGLDDGDEKTAVPPQPSPAPAVSSSSAPAHGPLIESVDQPRRAPARQTTTTVPKAATTTKPATTTTTKPPAKAATTKPTPAPTTPKPTVTTTKPTESTTTTPAPGPTTTAAPQPPAPQPPAPQPPAAEPKSEPAALPTLAPATRDDPADTDTPAGTPSASAATTAGEPA
ncbi:hypothetical protein GCM10010168_02550 [Actinoplanes ianthinogenes]|uniref:Uncharacterized protein n=1 Tax=Actinoplanes ianthinogenes TaxID=122358 RepID=A0ABM7LUS9_9ACTN|nr:hypothetical protein [Actinoplanes ianthinogenes]BCJ43004.1 hypothetical protein Aiant_36610 [Actinoplanes ianthinogenes]GGQ90854.1 hypothetical protein GCM10010168_02550 [Actinoplanes ianthinogenes]